MIKKSIVLLSILLFALFFVSSSSVSAYSCGDNLVVNHSTPGGVAPVDKTVTYSTVLTNLSGQDMCWISQNLGATDQASSPSDSDEDSAGWYWQFNRKQGYKHTGSAMTPPTMLGSIVENANWNAANDPCALELGSGWRMPTKDEWITTWTNGSWSNYSDAYNSVLKLHAGGNILTNTALNSRGTQGYYHTTIQSTTSSGWFLTINGSSTYFLNQEKTYARSIRCFHVPEFDSDPPSPSNFTPSSGETITNTTPTITFDLDENGDCRASTLDESYDDMSDDTDCTGDGSTNISCVLDDLGSDGDKNIYISCRDENSNGDTTLSNENLTYSLDTTAPSISLTAVSPDPTTDTTPALTGTATDVSSTVSSVEYQVDATDGSWTACTADDGTYDESSEAFTCSISPTLSEAAHTIYVRTTDSVSNVTANGSYAEDSFTIAIPTPTPTSAPTPIPGAGESGLTTFRPQIPQLSEKGGGAGVYIAQAPHYSLRQQIATILEPYTFKFDAFLFGAPHSLPTGLITLPNPVTGESLNYSYQPKNLTVAGGGSGRLLGIMTTNGTLWQVGNIYSVWYRAYAAGSDKPDAIIIPELQSKPSIVSLSYYDADLTPPGQPEKRFLPSSLKLAHSIDGINWRLLSGSTVDTTNRTVAAIHKLGGYYMIVGKL